jgi:hypothetical protein
VLSNSKRTDIESANMFVVGVAGTLSTNKYENSKLVRGSLELCNNVAVIMAAGSRTGFTTRPFPKQFRENFRSIADVSRIVHVIPKVFLSFAQCNQKVVFVAAGLRRRWERAIGRSL